MTAMIASTAPETTELASEPTTEATSIADTIRRGRVSALAGLSAKQAATGKVISIFDRTPPKRVARPVFHSVRKVDVAKLPPLLLTDPIEAPIAA